MLGYHSGLFDSAHMLVMEDIVSIVGFGDDNVIAMSEERTNPELQEDPHKHTAYDLSGELGFGLLNLVCFMGSLMFKFCLYLIAFVFVVLRRSWFSSKFYLHCQHSISSSDLHYSVENNV